MKLVSLLFTPVYYLPEKPISHQLSQRECFYLLVYLVFLVVTLASEVVFLKMPSRNQRRLSKQRAEYLQKQDENKAKARALYKANPDQKASVPTATRPIPKR